jgi:hypothetical protein
LLRSLRAAELTASPAFVTLMTMASMQSGTRDLYVGDAGVGFRTPCITCPVGGVQADPDT